MICVRYIFNVLYPSPLCGTGYFVGSKICHPITCFKHICIPSQFRENHAYHLLPSVL